MNNRDDIKRLCERIAAQGNLVEAAWVSYRLSVVPGGIDPADVDLMRMAFYGGAFYIFSNLTKQLQLANYTPDEPLLGHIRQIGRELEDYADDIDCSG